MLIQDQKVIVKWTTRNKKHYISKGYSFTNYGKYFEIDIQSLPKTSAIKVKFICDFCGKLYDKIYCREKVDGDACKNCTYKKASIGNLEKYEVECMLQLPEIRKKGKETMIQKYGVENAYQMLSVRQTMVNRYGVEYPFQSQEIRDRQNETMIKRYGFKNPGQVKKIQDRIKHTNLIRHGSECPWGNKEIHRKSIEAGTISMFNNGTRISSGPQRYI